MNKDNIEEIANLAKIQLNEDEKQKFASDFTNILDFIDSLKELDVSLADELSNTSDKSNQLREDIVEKWSEDMSQVHELEDSQFKVKRVL